MPVDTPTPIKRALISVSDKTGLADFGRFLAGQGVEKVVELGAGKVLSGLTKRIDRSLAGLSVETPEQLEAALAEI